jgi:predicted nucleotidyltransferase
MGTTQAADRVRAALENLRPTQEKVDLAVKIAIEVARPLRVILFGSWARGEALWDSDVDLAVLLPDSAEPELENIHRRLRRRLDEVPMTIDLVLVTEGCANQFSRSINSIYYRILTDGLVAYEQQSVHAVPDSRDQGG